MNNMAKISLRFFRLPSPIIKCTLRHNPMSVTIGDVRSILQILKNYPELALYTRWIYRI